MDGTPSPVDDSRPAQIRVHLTSRTAHVEVSGELDLSGAPALAQALAEHLGGPRQVLVDMSQVVFADCAALGVLLNAYGADPTLRLFAPSRPVLRLLRLAEVTIPCFGEG